MKVQWILESFFCPSYHWNIPYNKSLSNLWQSKKNDLFDGLNASDNKVLRILLIKYFPILFWYELNFKAHLSP